MVVLNEENMTNKNNQDERRWTTDRLVNIHVETLKTKLKTDTLSYQINNPFFEL